MWALPSTAVFWIVPMSYLMFNWSRKYRSFLGTVPRAPTIMGITFAFTLHILPTSVLNSEQLVIFSFFAGYTVLTSQKGTVCDYSCWLFPNFYSYWFTGKLIFTWYISHSISISVRLNYDHSLFFTFHITFANAITIYIRSCTKKKHDN